MDLVREQRTDKQDVTIENFKKTCRDKKKGEIESKFCDGGDDNLESKRDQIENVFSFFLVEDVFLQRKMKLFLCVCLCWCVDKSSGK